MGTSLSAFKRLTSAGHCLMMFLIESAALLLKKTYALSYSGLEPEKSSHRRLTLFEVGLMKYTPSLPGFRLCSRGSTTEML